MRRPFLREGLVAPRRRHLFWLLVCAPLLGGWDHVLSPEAFFSVSPGVEYRHVAADPERYPNVTLTLAGAIAENETSGEGTVLEILCYTRDRDDKPEDPDPECGRFVARTGGVLDPEAYRPGRLVTLTGKLVGRAPARGAEGRGSRLLFEIGEIYLWPLPAPRRRLPPRFRDPWCDPWRDPFCDPWCDPFCHPFYRPYYRSRFGIGFGHRW